MTRWLERLDEDASARAKKNLTRAMRVVAASQPQIVNADGHEYRDFCSNDYLGLSRHPEVIAAAQSAAAQFGAGARASRLITGNTAIHEELEASLAAFKGSETALVFPSGYQANLGLLSLLLKFGDAVFVDRLAHSCLVDGVRLSSARLRVFPHNDLENLGRLLHAARGAPARWIVIESVYSMDGDIAPLDELLDLAVNHDATIILDDAHGAGVIGRSGRGAAEHFGIDPQEYAERLIVTATLSKALGTQGGVVFGPRQLRDALVNASRPFVYTTGLSPICAAAALAALNVLEREPERPRQLQAHSQIARGILQDAGLDTLQSETAIIPILCGEAATALDLSEKLKSEGLLLLPIRPPTVPRGTSRLRMTVTLANAQADFAECCTLVATTCRSLLSPPAESEQHPKE
ncbi:8-amino-7-oxononanoate synthase [soil metagenome]